MARQHLLALVICPAKWLYLVYKVGQLKIMIHYKLIFKHRR